ncbi:MAG: hypothetical protein KGN32_01520 [Burkholderiales bacterium]|nr:hypothetical protein [Burkholderiales bacterium]
MQQKELATLLDISPAMVSRLAKRGMPTDSLERAQRWRKRHLEPGRVKGSRYDPSREVAANTPAAAIEVPPLPSVVLFEIEDAGAMVDAALIRGNQYGAAIRTWQLRELIRTPRHWLDYPRLSVRVWLSLLGYMTHQDAEVRNAPDMGTLLTPGEYGARWCPASPWAAHTVLCDACDWDDDALNGYPDQPDDGD